MSLKIPNFYHQSPLSSPQSGAQRKFSIPRHRGWKRRKLKLKSTQNLSLTIRCNFNFNSFDSSPFENIFRSLISQFSSGNSLDLLAPALGLASGAAIFFSQFREKSELIRIPRKHRNNKFVGEWILFTSPTPFNRFVVLRCPSISFEGSELLEDVNEKLIKEDRHFVRLNSGRIQVKEGEVEEAEKVVYQRVCIGTEDGGVLSLDWPANLGLEEERGLDTTILIVPGTAEGSMEKDIREFVCESLRRGCFTVVMNPRGCAGSPLTTPRLFTAADSDDISTAVQFINKARPWTTMMGVGWGYGANMLTKYLAEVGEKTPLTAATCIDNPFDLEEVTRSTPCDILLDRKLKAGLIDILRSNKELFQGRAKGFNVEKALLSTSVRDFEKAISMVSYGFDEIEDFYAKSSTRDMVGKVKIPLLFIQNDNGTVPLFSTPRSLIAENPFTSLLLCSYFSSKEITSSKSTVSWCQHLTIEWLAAVELGLLKGRHPLLKDVDVNINPPKGLALVESKALHQNGRVNKLLNVPNFDALGAHPLNPAKDILEAGDTRAKTYSRSKQESKGLRPDKDSLGQSSSIDAQLVREEVTNPEDGEMGQVLQTAKVVMNMLDVTMPNTLMEEQKRKVLTAVGQGETLIKALQDAVPEDVRGKLTTAVSGILHSDPNLKMDRLLSLGRIPDVASRLKSKVQEKAGQPSADSGNEDPQPSAQSLRTDGLADGSTISKDKTSVGPEFEPQASEYVQQSPNSNQFSMTNGNAGEILDSEKKATNDSGNHIEIMDSSRDRTDLGSDSLVNGSETVSKPELPSRSEGTVSAAEDMVIEQHRENDSGKGQSSMKGESSNQEDEVKTAESSRLDETISIPATQTDNGSSAAVPMSERQILEKDGDSSLKREENSVQAGSTEDGSNLPSFDVSQAFDAFTGIDDSTQVAVNSVFNVIEGMITQLEEGRENGDVGKDGTNENQERKNIGYEPERRGETQDQKVDPTAQKQFTADDHKLEKLEDNRNEKSIPCDSSFGIHTSKEFTSNDHCGRDPAISSGTDTSVSWETHSESYKREGNGRIKDLPARKLSTESPVGHLNVIYQPNLMSVTTILYGDHLYKEVLQKYLMSKMRNTEMLDLDTTATLFLDYSPEEGKWKLLEEPQNNNDNMHGDITDVKGETEAESNFSTDVKDTDSIIEPSYVIFDSDRQEERVERCKKTNNSSVEIGDDNLEELLLLVKSIILDTLKLEVERRVSDKDIEEMQLKLAKDLELVANAVCLSVGHDEQVFIMRGKDPTLDKFGTLEGSHVIRAITSAVQETSYLGRVLPVGVIVGSSLAALRNYFDVAALNSNSQNEHLILDQVDKSRNINRSQLTMKDADKMVSGKMDQKDDWDSSVDKCSQSSAINSSNGNTVMVGAVTAALGASALLMEQKSSGTRETLLKPLEDQDGHFKGPNNEEEMSEKTQNNIVTSLAEKALLVASPMVPTKEDGGVDHERLVTMLTELGQKGGMLRLVGKIALLWGGIRGALSLTDKLISFLHIAEQPLFQRIAGFVLMVLVLWSPIVVPLLPTLVQSWATHNSPRIAEFACLVGLCVSIMLMVTLWGKRIRGYDNPLEQYGLDLTSPSKVQHFASGVIGGVMLVLLIHYVNFVSGFVHPSMPTYLPSSSDAVTWLRVCGRLLWLVLQGLATATGVAIVEELLFRSWLPDEIAADFGYYRGVVISGLAFSLSQRSPWAIPGLWLLSLGLAGARQRSQGSLSLPIGLRAGIIVSSFILQRGGFLTYRPSLPNWLCGSHPFEPFSGIVGVAFSLALAIILYPRQPLLGKNTGAIREFSKGSAKER